MNNDYYKKLGERITAIRKVLNLKQGKLVDALESSGLFKNRAVCSCITTRYQRGALRINVQCLEIFAELFDVSTDFLLSRNRVKLSKREKMINEVIQSIVIIKEVG